MDKAKKIIKRTLIYIFLIIVSIISIFPCYWMFISAFNSTEEIVAGRMIPSTHLIENIKNLFATYDIWSGLRNSLVITLTVVLSSLFISSLAAYGFEKKKTRISEKTYVVFLIGMMIPFTAIVIPLYKMMASIHLVNTLLAVILPAVGSIFLVFFFRQSFKALPDEILECARIDGAGEFRIFLQIVMPSMKATYAAAAVYAFMTAWNNYMWPLIALSSPKKQTIILQVSKIITAGYYPDYGVQMIGLVIATCPVAVMFFTLQRSFVDGLTGSVKG